MDARDSIPGRILGQEIHSFTEEWLSAAFQKA